MIFRTKDGWITVLTLFRDNPLQLLCQAFGVDDMSQDPALATTDLQIENLQKIYDSFGPVVERYSTAECLEKLSQTDILCSPINDLSEVIDHPQTLENGMIWDVPVPGSEPARLVGNPVRLSRTPAQVYRGVTDIGAESEQVLSSFGFPDDEIAALKSSGVIL
jgi:crotonobetainyl-CoA:carnitine CoA-transferase CaiB-like acyl-CoA transferase